MGLTEMAVPLVAGMLPGVMTPAPFAKAAVRVAVDPDVMVAGVAVKLEMATAGGGGVEPHPVKAARLRAMASEARARGRFMGLSVARSDKRWQRMYGLTCLPIAQQGYPAKVPTVKESVRE